MERSKFELVFRLVPEPPIMSKRWFFLRVYFRPSVKFETYTVDPGGHFRNFWVGMCYWDPGTLELYQS